MWTRKSSSFKGKYYNIANPLLFPKPIQTPHPPIWIGSLTELSTSAGYWFLMTAPDTLNLIGGPLNPNQIYNLHSGANLISFPVPGNVGISEGLPDDMESQIVAIITAGTGAMNTDIGWVGSLINFEGGVGYWFLADSSLSFSYNLEGLSRTALESYSEILPEGYHFHQSSEQAFYFVRDIILPGRNIEFGDWVLSYCGEAVTGIRQWHDNFMDIPVMGIDNSDLTDGYCAEGDVPSFKLLRQDGELINLINEDGIPQWKKIDN